MRVEDGDRFAHVGVGRANDLFDVLLVVYEGDGSGGGGGGGGGGGIGRGQDGQFLLVAVGGVDVDGVIAVDVALDPDYLVAGLHVS